MQVKSSKSLCLFLAFAAILAISLSAFGQSVTRSVVFSRQAKIGSQAVSQGKYTAAFDEKKNGEMTLTRDGKEILKANYTLVELTKPAVDSAIVFTAADDGSFKVRRIEIKGLKSALQFD